MARTGRPVKYATPLQAITLRLPLHELAAIDAEPGTVRNDKIRELLRDRLASLDEHRKR